MLWSKALSVLSAEFGLRALKKNAAVVTAESCTAGGVAHALGATPARTQQDVGPAHARAHRLAAREIRRGRRVSGISNFFIRCA